MNPIRGHEYDEDAWLVPNYRGKHFPGDEAGYDGPRQRRRSPATRREIERRTARRRSRRYRYG